MPSSRRATRSSCTQTCCRHWNSCARATGCSRPATATPISAGSASRITSSAAIAARHVGALKPDPAIFRKVIEGTDLEPHEVVYVGDDPELDVEGARGAGMQAIWVDRERAANGRRRSHPRPHTVAVAGRAVELFVSARRIQAPTCAPHCNSACADCLAKTIGVHSAPFVVPLPAFFSGLASRVIEDPSFRPTSEKSDETANVRPGTSTGRLSCEHAGGRAEPVCNQASQWGSVRRSALGAIFQRELVLL